MDVILHFWKRVGVGLKSYQSIELLQTQLQHKRLWIKLQHQNQHLYTMLVLIRLVGTH